ncbi:MAG: hypothetical protein ACLUNQ_07510 [Oscillospiraceae bacterium]
MEKTGGHMGFSRTDIRDESGRLIAALRTVMYLTGRPAGAMRAFFRRHRGLHVWFLAVCGVLGLYFALRTVPGLMNWVSRQDGDASGAGGGVGVLPGVLLRGGACCTP